jgi:hypothetical protein
MSARIWRDLDAVISVSRRLLCPKTGSLKETVLPLMAVRSPKLDPEMLARLRSEFGISVELKSVKPGLTALLDNLTKGGAGSPSAAEYDRGFDRTNPGYDKFYDRDAPQVAAAEEAPKPGIEAPKPGIDASMLNKLSRP